jgi:hypothetical protein
MWDDATMIRSFQNADLPALHRLWLEYWSALGPTPAVREAQLEQAILSRTFFRADELLVATSDDRPQAWLQFCPSPHDKSLVVVPMICLAPSVSTSIASQLMQEALLRIRSRGVRRVRIGVARDNIFGYAGLEPIGHGVGIVETDTRLQAVLTGEGFHPVSSATAMSVSVIGFRPPMNRDAMQFRRTALVEPRPHRFCDSRQAAGMSHLDVEAKCLVNRDGQTLATFQQWLSDPEAEVMRPSLMILDLGDAHLRGQLTVAESYLIAAQIQEAANRNILTIETSVDDEKRELQSQLGALQFRPASRGQCWEGSA